MSWIPSIIGLLLNLMMIISLADASIKRNQILHINIKNQSNRTSIDINSCKLKPIIRKKISLDSKTNFQNESTELKSQTTFENEDVSRSQDLRVDPFKRLLKRASSILTPNISQEKQITIMLISISLTFLILTLPFSIHELLRKLYPNKEKFQDRITQRVVLFLLDCLHATNFILYCLIGKKFRNELKNILLCKPEERDNLTLKRSNQISKCKYTNC